VVITGASAGLGRAIAHRFARDGARLGLIAREQERLEATRQEVESLGGTAVICRADVADAAALDRAADRIEQELGPIGIWVNNAMVSVLSPVSGMQPDEFRRVTEVTYLGCVFGTLAALRSMRERNQGVIIQVGSALAHRSIPLQSAYCAAKHAVAGFTASLRCELLHEHSGVRVTMVQMPAMNTPQFEWVRSRMARRAQPVPPIFQPEVCAEAVHYAAHHDVGREMLVGWPTVQAVWGNKLVPALLDRYLGRTGFRSQQAEESELSGRPDNLWQPVPGGWGAHGRFDDRARRQSFQIWLRLRPAVAGAALAAISLAAVWLLLW
jgi:NAD(P)-dependent dehydrogenase (short-subunit alcohol dehydrogenase family)